MVTRLLLQRVLSTTSTIQHRGLQSLSASNSATASRQLLSAAEASPWQLPLGVLNVGKGLGARSFAAQVSPPPANLQRPRTIMDQVHALQKAVKRQVAAPARAGRAAKQQLLRTGEKAYELLPARGQKMIDTLAKPGSTQRVLQLHAQAFWAAHSRKVLAAAGLVVVYCLWRGLFKITKSFVDLSESMAEYGFLAFAVALALLGYLWLRRRWSIDPEAVYRAVMYRLNTNPGILEVMGAPVTGSGVRAMVTTGGGLTMRGLVPGLHSRRLQMIFPLAGPARRGLVSIEAKKRKGRYTYKLLAVDVPAAPNADQRLYLDGDDSVYNRGSVISELRDPFVNAIAMQETYEEEDDRDEAAEDALEAQAARQHFANAPRSFWADRLTATGYSVAHRVSSWMQPAGTKPEAPLRRSTQLEWRKGSVAPAAQAA